MYVVRLNVGSSVYVPPIASVITTLSKFEGIVKTMVLVCEGTENEVGPSWERKFPDAFISCCAYAWYAPGGGNGNA